MDVTGMQGGCHRAAVGMRAGVARMLQGCRKHLEVTFPQLSDKQRVSGSQIDSN